MSLKWKEISLLLEEARPVLIGSALQKIAQIRELAGGESFLLQGFGSAGPWRLWTSLLQQHSAWVLAEQEWDLESQPEPTDFVMVLRKRLIGRRIESLEQVRQERIILMHFDEGLSLMFELLPKKANLLLVDGWNREERTARCIQSFRQVSLESGGIYRLLPPPEAGVTSDDARDFSAEEGKPFAYHHAVAAHYWDSVQQTGFAAYQRRWRQAWKSHSKKVKSALENGRADLEESREAELFQKRGMALVAHLYELGAKKFPSSKKLELDGLEIPLDVTKTFSDNAEAFFKKSKKFNRAVQELEVRVEELEKKFEKTTKVAAAIEAAKDDAALEKLARDFEKEGIAVPEKEKEEEKEAPEAKLFLEVESSDGFKILCGRNQEENRQVTFRECKGNDLWVHVKGLPGAHVVIKEQRNKTVPLSTLLEAAQLCLYHSKIRKGKRAEVDYTKRKNVRAIKGTIAEVTYTGNKTLYVEADPDALKKLMRN